MGLSSSILRPPAASGGVSGGMSELTEGHSDGLARYQRVGKHIPRRTSRQTFEVVLHFADFPVNRRCALDLYVAFTYLVRCSLYRVSAGEDLIASCEYQSETIALE